MEHTFRYLNIFISTVLIVTHNGFWYKSFWGDSEEDCYNKYLEYEASK